MTYLLISNLSLALFFLIYRYGLRKLTFFTMNRWYLLSSVLIAYIMPLFLFIELQVPEIMQITLPVLDLTGNAVQVSPTSAEVQSQQPGWLADNWMQLGYWLGVLIAAVLLLSRVLQLVIGRLSVGNIHGSYSFFNIVKLNVKNEDTKFIREHEDIHVKQGHSYDIMFMEIIRVFNWFNPLLIWIRDELKYQHEFIVDEQFADNKVAYAELLVAYAMNVHPNQLSHEFSNKSLLKERINMIFKDKSNTRNRLFYLSILPIAALIMGLVVNCKSPNKDKTESTVVVEENTNPQISADSNNNAEVDQGTVSNEDQGISSGQENDLKKDSEVKDANKANPHDEPGKKVTGNFGVFEFDQVEVKPTYPGGIDKFRQEVGQNLEYPQEAIDAGIRGKIELSFVIGKDGEIKDVKVIKDLNYGTGQAAVNALKGTKKWSPGIAYGFPADVRYILPIRLDLSQM